MALFPCETKMMMANQFLTCWIICQKLLLSQTFVFYKTNPYRDMALRHIAIWPKKFSFSRIKPQHFSVWSCAISRYGNKFSTKLKFMPDISWYGFIPYRNMVFFFFFFVCFFAGPFFSNNHLCSFPPISFNKNLK